MDLPVIKSAHNIFKRDHHQNYREHNPLQLVHFVGATKKQFALAFCIPTLLAIQISLFRFFVQKSTLLDRIAIY
jgi:hypothetical protein